MAELIDDDKPLPQFRADLKPYQGPDEPDGSPTINIFDPVVSKFYRFTWAESLIFNRLKPKMTLIDLVNDLNNNTTLTVTKDEVKQFLIDCFRLHLLDVPLLGDHLYRVHQSKQLNPFMWLLMNYLFLRLPLFNPDKFLTRTLPYVRFLASTPAFCLYTLVGAFGICLLFLKFGEFLGSFNFFFNLEGFFDYFFAIFFVKIIHEFSHAYTAKRYGLYVPSMGIALIVLWPVLYTDVSDGWKLQSRKQRLYISAAGVIAETIIAGFCTIGWALTEPGVLNNIFYVIASVTWVSTLVINLNPAVRFDGYYMFCDIWGVDNLQNRSFAVTRWKLREWFLGIETPCPEPQLPSKQLAGFIVYSLYTWIYRLGLYTTIAIFVYHRFTKALGIFLFFVEIGIFIIWPIIWEIKELKQLKSHLSLNVRSMLTLGVLGIIFAWAVFPLPHRLIFPGITVPVEQQVIYVPHDSIIQKVFIHRGETVKKGQELIQLDSPSLTYDIANLKVENMTLAKQIDVLSKDESQLSYIPQKQAELASNEEKLSALQNIKDQLKITAAIPGQVFSWDDYNRTGRAVAKDYVLGKIADYKDFEITFFVPEEDLNTVQVGQSIVFNTYPEGQSVRATISRINPLSTKVLDYPALGSTYKGKIPVNQDPVTERLTMIDSYYTATAKVDPDQPVVPFGKTGDVETKGPWRSNLVELIRAIMRTLWREGSV